MKTGRQNISSPSRQGLGGRRRGRGRPRARALKVGQEGCPGRMPGLMTFVKEAEAGTLATVTAAWVRVGQQADKDCGQELSGGDGGSCWC